MRTYFLIAGTGMLLAACGTSANNTDPARSAQPGTGAGTAQAKATLSADEAARLAMQQFDAYLPRILKTYDGAALDIAEPHTGDFTGDGLPDVAIYFALTPAGGGNALAGQGISLYRNTGDGVQVIAGYEPDYLFAFDTISAGKVQVTKLRYAKDDGHCCPSVREPHTLTITGSKAY